MAIVMPRSFSSGALSIWSKGVKSAMPFSARHLGDRRGQRGLAVVDVTDRADVDVGLVPLELLLGHLPLLLLSSTRLVPGRRSPSRSAREPPCTRAAASGCAPPGPGSSTAGRSRSRTARPAARARGSPFCPARSSMCSMRPRRAVTSPMTSPMNSSGVMTSNSMTGSSSTGSALRARPQRHLPGDLERHLRRVDLVVRAVDQRRADVDHRVAGQHARRPAPPGCPGPPPGCTPAGSRRRRSC